MPYAIIGIISLGLVITSIRTMVVERGHLRKRLLDALERKRDRHIEHLKKRIRRYHTFSSWG
jgi:hypothetical protein